MGLLEALKQYASDAVGGSLNPEIGNTLSGLLNYGKDRAKYIGGLLDDSSPINQDLQNWHKRTQLGLADLIAGREGPQADYGYSQLMNMAGVAPLGITAWHGSPHKFDKFSLDKIGTGEGAQAYGHGLYLAENPGVAQSYQIPGGQSFSVGGKSYAELQNSWHTLPKHERYAITALADSKGNAAEATKNLIDRGMPDSTKAAEILQQWDAAGKIGTPSGNLYKTDIPDEAVARFLDWDKPLSQQAPEVVAALERSKNKHLRSMIDYAKTPYSEAIGGEEKTMGEAFRLLNLNLQGKSSADSAKASAFLAKQGIPGIRYLDGGSRSAGQGSSNFVVFDPEMIRILERNGQPTGMEPWKPGEYRLGDLLK